MAYIGNDLRSNEDYKIIDDISSGFDGSETSFALQVGGATPVPFPKFEQQLLISVNGVIQEPDPTGSAGFKLLGTNIVFSSAPTNGHAFFGVIYAGADYVNAGGTFPDGSINFPSITFSEDTNTGFTRIASGTVALISDGTKVAQFPTSQGSSGQALITDGGGNLSFGVPTAAFTDITLADSIIHSGDANTKIRFSGADTVSVETAGTQRLEVASDGKVNFGSVARVEADGVFKAAHGDASTPAYNFLNDNDNGMFRATTNQIGFSTAGSERMRIDSSGRLLIGHTSDIGYGFRSQLVGTDGNTSSQAQIRFTNSASGPTFILAKSRNGTPGSKTIVNNNDNLGEIQFRGDDGVDYFGIAASIKTQVDGTPGAGDLPGRLVFSTTADGSDAATERMRISQNGDITVNFDGSSQTGQILIADGSASAPGLSFWADGSNDTGIFRSGANTLNFSTNGTEHMRIKSDGDIQLTRQTSGGGNETLLISANYGSGSDQALQASNSLRFYSNGANERMRIASDGTIGIGTTSPESKLAIKASSGSADLFSISDIAVPTSGDEYGVAMIKSNAAAYMLSITAYNSNGKGLRIYNNGGSTGRTSFEIAHAAGTKFIVDGNGNVGTGIDTPSSFHSSGNQLVIGSGSGDEGMSIYSGTGSAGVINFADGLSGSERYMGRILYRHGDNAMSFHTNTGTERMRISSGGSVGIGTTSPQRTLHQHIGSSSANYHQFTNTGTGSGGGNGALVGIDANENAILWNQENTATRFGTNNTERARISNDGKFLMGSTGSLDMGFGPQVLSIRGGNTGGYQGTAAAVFGQTDNNAATCIFYNSSTANGTNMLDTRCARGGHSAYSFAIYRSNSAGDTEFRLRGDGNAYADGSWNGGGADYAEYFEWADGNSSDEDRRGYTVVLDGNKIRKSTSSDSAATIIGVISGNPSIVGDNDIDNWKQKYQKDDYGSYVLDSNGERILNSDWDETKEYVSREDRKEWSIVGLMGKIRIRKGQTMGTNWIKMQDISATVEEWLVR